MHSTDLPLFGSQRLKQRHVGFAKRAILGEGFFDVALVVVQRRQPRALIKQVLGAELPVTCGGGRSGNYRTGTSNCSVFDMGGGPRLISGFTV
jgi:hypothetical protein